MASRAHDRIRQRPTCEPEFLNPQMVGAGNGLERSGGRWLRRRGGGRRISADRRRVRGVTVAQARASVPGAEILPPRGSAQVEALGWEEVFDLPVRRSLRVLENHTGTRTSPSSNQARFLVERTALARSAMAFVTRAGGHGPRCRAIAPAQDQAGTAFSSISTALSPLPRRHRRHRTHRRMARPQPPCRGQGCPGRRYFP